MKYTNYKSDFDFILKIRDCRGNDVGWPSFDWSAKFYTTSKANSYTASCIDGECVNCFNDNGKIHVVVNNPGMGIGRLNVDVMCSFPNDIYPDGREDLFTPQPVDIELVSGEGDKGSNVEIQYILPFIKGEKGDDGEKGEKGDEPKLDLPQSILPLVSDVKTRRIPNTAQPGIVYKNHNGVVRLKLKQDSYGYYADIGDLYVRDSEIKKEDHYRPITQYIEGVYPGRNDGSINRGNPLEWEIIEEKYLYCQEKPEFATYIKLTSSVRQGDCVTIRRDKQGRRILTFLTLYRQWEKSRLPIPALDEVLLIEVNVNHRPIEVKVKGETGYQIQQWKKGGQMGRYSWRNCMRKDESGYMRPANSLKARRNTRTILFRVRRVSHSRRKSEWLYLRLHRTNTGGSWADAKLMQLKQGNK